MQGDQPDVVRVVYSAADIRAVRSACWTCRRNFLVMIAIIASVIAVLEFQSGRTVPESLLVSVIGGFAGAIAGLFVNFAMSFWTVRTRAKAGWAEPMAVRLDERGVVVTHPVADSTIHWPSIRSVSMKKDRIFLFTSAACAVILPRRAFDNDAHFTRWQEEAKSRWRNAS